MDTPEPTKTINANAATSAPTAPSSGAAKCQGADTGGTLTVAADARVAVGFGAGWDWVTARNAAAKVAAAAEVAVRPPVVAARLSISRWLSSFSMRHVTTSIGTADVGARPINSSASDRTSTRLLATGPSADMADRAAASAPAKPVETKPDRGVLVIAAATFRRAVVGRMTSVHDPLNVISPARTPLGNALR